MAKSEEMKIEELKRLLRRLDKALPPARSQPETDADFVSPPPLEVSPPPLDGRWEQALPPAVAIPLFDGPPAPSRPAARPPASTFAALRTVLLAAGVSAAVSLSIMAFVLYQNAPPRPLSSSDVRSTSSAPPAAETRAASAAELPPIAPQAAPAPTEATHTEPAASNAADTRQAAADVSPEPAQPQAPLETSSAEKSEPVQTAAPQQPEPEPTSSVATAPGNASEASSADRQTFAALDASQYLRRGLNMLTSGNVSAAQLLLERAAELGNAEAAYALATTYDGAPGAPRSGSAVRPNADLALRWYERARELGVEDARKRLGELKQDTSSGG